MIRLSFFWTQIDLNAKSSTIKNCRLIPRHKKEKDWDLSVVRDKWARFL